MFQVAALTDTVVNVNADLGMRYSAVADHPAFPEMKGEYVGRVQGALDRLAELATAASSRPGAFLVGDRWTLADISVLAVTVWLETMPARVAHFPPAKNILALGWKLPGALRVGGSAPAAPEFAALG